MIPRILLLYSLVNVLGCQETPASQKENSLAAAMPTPRLYAIPYDQLKTAIDSMRKAFAQKYRQASSSGKDSIMVAVKDYWVTTLGVDLFSQWQHTRWDFNGTASAPQQGNIACGYFVTTLLRDMNYQLDRIKLATCVSMKMMRTLTPEQPIKNLSYVSYADFTEKIRNMGKGVFVIGLDYHTGFIIHDGTDCWFLHSNYIRREGVIKEKLGVSAALKASKTRFVTQLTADRAFLLRWLNV